MRKLKHHEKKLLRKVDFLQWRRERASREIEVMRRYHVQDRDDYVKYNKLVGHITRMIAKLKELPADDPVRIQTTEALLQKLYDMGLITTAGSLVKAENISVSAFCRRRLPVVMVRLKLAETVRQAVTLVEQGHVRVGPNVVTDPAFAVTRSFEDFVTWVDTSKIRRTVAKYNDALDDYDLLGA